MIQSQTAAIEPSRLIRWAAWLVPACVLPSALWRVYAITQIPPGCPDSPGTRAYMVGLSAVSFGAAFLTVGLVSEWGRRLPRWVPGRGGRPINPRVVIAAACVGIAVLASVDLYAVLNPIFTWRLPNDKVPGCPPPDQTDGAWLAYAAYAPILLWLPLLTVVTIDFARRIRLERRAHVASRA
ncbi:hypothetical protein [Intrasporangium sp.]|uniref:hypothetical protein n=1 Tax=Intrasporangium sp. TaxID=1925024 RepID=UPI002939B279|nr:hypothetical protein [Intrasporangium sp.]MDV3220355.1 hypothetical protein [Intrasporangium sp.]